MLSSRKYFVGASMVALVVGFVAAMVCVLALVAVASAGAKRAEALPRPGVQDISGTRTNPLIFVTEEAPLPRGAGSITRVEVRCPSQYLAIGGGFDVRRYFLQPWLVTESRPSMPDRYPDDRLGEGEGWVVSAYNQTLDIPPFDAYAVCVPKRILPWRNDAPVTYPHESKSRLGNQNPANKTVSVTPACKPGKKAIGGGFDRRQIYPKDSYDLQLIRSQPNPGNGFRSWIVASRNENVGQKLTAFSVCVEDDGIKNLYHEDEAATGGSDTKEVTATTKPCRGDTYLLSGGFGVADGDASWINWSYSRPGPGSRLDPPLNWRASMKAVGKRTVHAFAMCGELSSLRADGKLSGKNPGWGDGMGGGRFK
jgi:hypothetical protein